MGIGRMTTTRVLKLSVKRVNELRFMPYADYLESPEWHKIRSKVAEYRGNRCDLCGEKIGKDRGQVHHKTYERKGRELFSDLSLLCGRCHHYWHSFWSEQLKHLNDG